MTIKRVAAAGITAAALALSACGTSSGGNAGPQVVASFYPFAYVAQQIGGPDLDVQNLTSPGMEPHDLELKPKQVGSIIDADLVIYEKDFQAAVDTAVDQADRDERNLVDTAEVVDILTPAEEEAGHASDGHAEGDGHDHGAIDPHIWLDPLNMDKIADAVTAKLVALHPDKASTYEANSATFKTALSALDASYRTGLATCETREIVTSHAAFAYLANRYGLHQIAIAGIDPSNEPSPAQLADITDHVKRNKITTVFTEELVSPAVAKTVANATGASLATLDPIEGLGKDASDQTYLTLMKRNLTALMKANRCT